MPRLLGEFPTQRSRSQAGATLLFVALAALSASGCGSFAPPPPPPELDAIGSANQVPTITVELLLAGEEAVPRPIWSEGARLEAANSKAIFTKVQLAPNDPPAKMAGLIEKAVERGISALVSEPVEGPEFIEAVNRAREKGTAVVVLNRKVTASDPSKPIPTVAFEPLDKYADQLGKDVYREAKFLSLPLDGSALLLIDTEGIVETETKSAAFSKGLEAAGIKQVTRLEFSGDANRAAALLKEKLKSDPKIIIVVTQGEFGLNGAVAVHDELSSSRNFVIGALASIDQAPGAFGSDACSVVIDRNEAGLIRQAVKEAVKLTKKEAVADETFVPLRYHDLSGSGKLRDPLDASSSAPAPDPALAPEKPKAVTTP